MSFCKKAGVVTNSTRPKALKQLLEAGQIHASAKVECGSLAALPERMKEAAFYQERG